MSLKEFPDIQRHISDMSEKIKTPEAINFDYDKVAFYLSDENKNFLSSMSSYPNIYFFCQNDTLRWQDHPYQEITKKITDTDYNHVAEMLIISKDIENLNIQSIDFNIVQLMILAHDGGESGTGDISANHIPTDQPLQKIKELEPKVFISVILKQVKEREFYSQRRKIRELYKRYESRNDNLSDTESHLVKLIDIFQGDNFGMENVYSKTKLKQFYGNNIPVNSDVFVEERINKELNQLKTVLENLSNPQDKLKLFSYYRDYQFSRYSKIQHNYQNLFDKYKQVVNNMGDSIRQTLPSF